MMAGRYAHAKQFKRHHRELRILRSWLGRILTAREMPRIGGDVCSHSVSAEGELDSGARFGAFVSAREIPFPGNGDRRRQRLGSNVELPRRKSEHLALPRPFRRHVAHAGPTALRMRLAASPAYFLERRAAMLDQAHQYPASTVYAAIELSKKSWVVAIMQPARDQPSIHRIKGGAFSDLVTRLRAATRRGERLLVCYEAGYDGFWLARSLEAEKLECRVLDPASLQGQSPSASCQD